MGGSSPGNVGIFYPDGSVYLGDMPNSGDTGEVTPEIAERKLHGMIIDGQFVHVGANGVYHPSVTEDRARHSIGEEFVHAYSDLVRGEVFQPHTESLMQVQTLYSDLILRNELDLDAELTPAQSLERGCMLYEQLIETVTVAAEVNPRGALGMLDIATNGYGSRAEVEERLGLNHSDAPYDFLYMEWQGLEKAFPNYVKQTVKQSFSALRKSNNLLHAALYDAALDGLVEQMPAHAQLAEFANRRERSITIAEAQAKVMQELAIIKDTLRLLKDGNL